MALLRRLLGIHSGRPPEAPAENQELLRRVREIESDRAALRLEIGALITRAEEILETAERKRRRAAAAESKLRAREDEENASAQEAPMDLETYRERLRRGEIQR